MSSGLVECDKLISVKEKKRTGPVAVLSVNIQVVGRNGEFKKIIVITVIKVIKEGQWRIEMRDGRWDDRTGCFGSFDKLTQPR